MEQSYKNLKIVGGQIELHTIDYKVEVCPSPFPDDLKDNVLLSEASRTASRNGSSASNNLPQLYLEIVKSNGRYTRQDIANVLFQILDEKFKDVPDMVLQKGSAIEILATIALHNGIGYNPSGSFVNAYSKLRTEVHKLFERHTNLETHASLKKLVEGAYVLQGKGYEGGPILIATSNIDPYLDNPTDLVKKAKNGESRDIHSLKETIKGTIGHLVPTIIRNNLISQ
jgi:hypothetical protein